MTVTDKVIYCSGADFWLTKKLEQYNIPEVMLCDGPHGLRKQEGKEDMLGVNDSVPATCFPAEVLSACSWNEALLGEIGEAIAKEAAAAGVGLVLGPGANLKRNPLCGRNFEYFSEDPYLSGKLAAAYIKSAQTAGAGACVKHFALNSQEFERFCSDSVIDERTMRELYLTSFEIAVKEGRPSAVMCAYNKINGTHCSNNRKLLTEILRNEWGFEGMTVTDWGAMCNRIEGFRAGCDLSMPGGSGYMEAECIEAVYNKSLPEADVDASALRILRLAERTEKILRTCDPVDMQAHYELAKRAAAESAVLLKNEDSILPLSSTETVAFIGQMAENMRYQGAGSSHINPWKLVSIRQACPIIPYAQGYDRMGETSEELIGEAKAAAEAAQTAVVFAGLPDNYESEGFDRNSLKMPDGHIRLIEAVAEVNKNTVVVLMCGGVVEIPWEKKVKAVLYMGLPGEAGGEAVADLLWGRAVPSGKLAETWPVRYEDCVCSSYYGKHDAHYREGLYAGYRYYASAKVPVRYPFGFGLSYSSFSYSNLSIDGYRIACDVKNTGNTAAKEIAELYVQPPAGRFYRPVMELKSFRKLELQPGETKQAVFRLTGRSFAVWNGGWMIPGGIYKVLVGGSSDNLPLTGIISLKEERFPQEGSGSTEPDVRPPDWYFSPKGVPSHEDFEKLLGHPAVDYVTPGKGSFTMENTVMEMKAHSLIMKIMFRSIESTVAREFGGKKDYGNPVFKMRILASAGASLSSMKINGGMHNYLMEGMLELANGHYWKGIGLIMKRKPSVLT